MKPHPHSFHLWELAAVRRWPLITLAAVLLCGCAGMHTVTSDVSSYGSWPASRWPGSYVFERLPSQQAHPGEQARLENAARGALETAGFTPAANPQAADVAVQVGTRLLREDRLVNEPLPWHGGFWGSMGWHGSGFGVSTVYSAPQYGREISLLLRDRSTGQPLYEAHAVNDNGGSDEPALLAAMFEAALKDFPQPAINPRRISIQLTEKP